ncbi:MAG TPA: hypothetical protein VG407_01690 [Caulobacteraceae bacterium]|nr:hypothetical protein [Caulobacteraceae bacterium]
MLIYLGFTLFCFAFGAFLVAANQSQTGIDILVLGGILAFLTYWTWRNNGKTVQDSDSVMFDDSVVKTIYSPDRQVGLAISRGEDGLFSSYEIWLHDVPTVGKTWRPKPGGWEGGSYETAEIAEREARVSVPWLIEK